MILECEQEETREKEREKDRQQELDRQIQEQRKAEHALFGSYSRFHLYENLPMQYTKNFEL